MELGSESYFDYHTINIELILDGEVIVTWSGGPDSTGLIHILLEKYSCVVHPLFINRTQKNYPYEKESVEHYTEIFSKYPKFRKPIEATIVSPPKEFRNFGDCTQYALRNSDIINQAVRLALHKKINTVFLATFDDENLHSDGSIEYLEAKTIEIRKGTDKNDFVVCSPFHFPIKFPNRKPVLFKACYDNNFDLTKTRSCYNSNSIHCGTCNGCINRHQAFIETHEDQTKYETTPKTSYENRVEKTSG